MKVVHIYDDRTFADVQCKGQVGLMKLGELRLVLPEGEDGGGREY